MKVCIDTRWLSNKNSGVGHHIKCLFEQVLKKEAPFEIYFFGSQIEGSKTNYIQLEGLKKKFYQGLWKTIKFPSLEFLTGEADLFHFTNLTGIPNKAKRNILTAHDFAFKRFPETIEPKNLKFLQDNVLSSLNKANHVICVSESTKQDLIDFYQFPENRISVIYNGIEDFFLNESSPVLKQKVKHKYNLNKKYLLSVSTIEPRKNYRTMIEAYSKINSKLLREYELVIVGSNGWAKEKDRLMDLIKTKNLTGKVRFLDFVDRIDLKAIYQQAELYLHTSLSEGFGMGIVEAMASELPVIISDVSCHREIATNSALYYNVLDSDDLACKIELLLIDEERRKKIIESGKERVKFFSWEKSAEKTIEVYKKTLLDF